MTEADRSLRVRALLDAWLPVLVLALLVLAVASGWWAYQVNAVPEVEEEQRTVTEWSESTAYEHSALILNDSLPFEEGERVTDRPVYYTTLSDDLNVTYQYTYTAEEGEGDLAVTSETFLLFRSLEGDEILWEYREPLASAATAGLEPGEDQTVSMAVNIESVFETIDTVEQQLGVGENIEIVVVTVSEVDGFVGGEEVSQTYESTMTIEVSPQTFRVLEIETIDEDHERVETVEVPVEPSTTESLGSILAFVLSIALLAGVALARYNGLIELTEDEREVLEIYQQEQEFSDWITTGTFPSERDYETTILVDDLEGLVDVAIDSNKRVIKDEQLGVSTVLDEDYAYIYVPPNSPASDWLVNYADVTMDEFEDGDVDVEGSEFSEFDF